MLKNGGNRSGEEAGWGRGGSTERQPPHHSTIRSHFWRSLVFQPVLPTTRCFLASLSHPEWLVWKTLGYESGQLAPARLNLSAFPYSAADATWKTRRKRRGGEKQNPTMFESKVVLLPRQIFSTLDSFYGSDIYKKMGSRMAGSRHLKSLSALGPYEAAPEPAAV